MRKCAECLCPNHAEVAYPAVIDLGEDSIEDIAEKVHA